MIFKPTQKLELKDLRVVGLKDPVTGDNLSAVVVLINKLAGERRTKNIASAICGVYDCDCPWLWHLERIVATYPTESFDDVAWITTFIQFYMDFINRIEQEILDTTGTRLSFSYAKV